MLAELLAHVLARAVIDTLAPRPVLHLPGRAADLAPAQVGVRGAGVRVLCCGVVGHRATAAC